MRTRDLPIPPTSHRASWRPHGSARHRGRCSAQPACPPWRRTTRPRSGHRGLAWSGESLLLPAKRGAGPGPGAHACGTHNSRAHTKTCRSPRGTGAPVFRRCPSPSSGPADVRLAVVAHAAREDLLQPRDLGRRGSPRAVHAACDRGLDRLQRALVHAARGSGRRPRSVRSSGAGTPAHTRPWARCPGCRPTRASPWAISVPAVVKQRSVASAGLLPATPCVGVRADVGHPLVDHLERLAASGRPAATGVRP